MDLEQLLWAALEGGDLEALKQLSQRGVDWNKASAAMTPLLKTYARILETDYSDEKYFNIMEWLVRQGADPTYRFPATWPSLRTWLPHGRAELKISGMSVLQLADVMRQLARRSAETNHIVSSLSNLIQRITAASLDLTSSQRHQVHVDQSVVDHWERFLGSTSSHDVTFLTADAPVTAHASFLQEASRVLKAMLSSSMKEGETRQIEVRDASRSAVQLFLEILYTCSSSSSEPSCEDTLAALDLAHRWQIGGVVGILEEILQATQTKLKKKGCPKAVLELFDATEQPPEQSAKRRRRF
eukprot:Skav211793  [mRNA]  locus=scaffold305:268434:270184:+ [translate_table: standard]